MQNAEANAAFTFVEKVLAIISLHHVITKGGAPPA